MSDNMTKPWPWAVIVMSLLAAPACGQSQTLVLWDTKGWSLDILRPRLQEPGVVIKSGAPDAEFRARSEKMFREWIADWPRDQLARQLTDSSLKTAKASLMTAEASRATARADLRKIVTTLLDDWRRYILSDLRLPRVDLPARGWPRPRPTVHAPGL